MSDADSDVTKFLRVISSDKLAPNVAKFMSDTATRYARNSEAQFLAELTVCGEVESPIEQLFLIACYALRNIYGQPEPEPLGMDVNREMRWSDGMRISRQEQVGPYRVDFVLSVYGGLETKYPWRVVVELDGHAFHDKDQRQRGYEKARDRYLVKTGCKVLHYTGSEVVADPYRVAFEALSLLGVPQSHCCEEYDPKNPLGPFW